MPLLVQRINLDLLGDRAHVVLAGDWEGDHTMVDLSFMIKTPGNQPENRLQEITKETARKVLKEALDGLK